MMSNPPDGSDFDDFFEPLEPEHEDRPGAGDFDLDDLRSSLDQDSLLSSDTGDQDAPPGDLFPDEPSLPVDAEEEQSDYPARRRSRDVTLPAWLSGAAPPTSPPAWDRQLPIWLRKAEPPPPIPFGVGQLPPWLRTAVMPADRSPASSPPPERPSEDLPEWLAAADLPAPPEPETPDLQPPPVEEPEAEAAPPDWIAAIDEMPPLPGAPADEERERVPEWLRDVEREPLSSVPELPDLDEETPDWLEEAEEELQNAAPSPAEELPLPDWLSGEQAAEEAPIPDWLGAALEAAIEEEEGTPQAEPSGEPPEWAETPPVPAEAEPPRETPDTGDLRWLRELDEDETALSTVGTGSIGDLEDLLPLEPAPLDAEPISTDELKAILEEPAQLPYDEEQAAADELAWMAGLGVEGPPDLDIPIPIEGGEDLLGLSAPLEVSDEEEPQAEEASDITPGQLPSWLRDLKAEEPIPIPETEEVDPLLAEQIEDLRFDAIAGAAAAEPAPAPERVGALKDMAGVIRPEMIFEGSALSVADLVEGLVVTDRQQQQVDRLVHLMERETAGEAAARRPDILLPLLRLLVALALIAAVAAPALFKVELLPAAVVGPGPAAAYEAISALPEGAVVLAVFEYEPDTAGELEPMAQVVLAHVAERAGELYAVSTRPTGPAMAQAVLSAPAVVAGRPDSSRWLNLGFVPGRSAAVSTLMVNQPRAIPSPLAIDYRGEPSGLESADLAELDADLLIVFAARWEDLRPWLEQAGPLQGTPLIAGVSVGTAPLAYPYQASGQIAAVLSGLNDAAAYQAQRGLRLEPALLVPWNAQAAAGAAAALLIVVGIVVFGAMALRKRQEHER
ncbi:MAG: hypothetical protein Kow00124_07370 [Anaerolineae bacterium]